MPKPKNISSVPRVVPTGTVEIREEASLFLVEFSEMPEINHVINEEGGEAATSALRASGLSIHRVIAPDHTTVAAYQGTTPGRVPLDFLTGKGPVILAYASPPKEAGGAYGWGLMELLPVEEGEDAIVASVKGIRSATAEETSTLEAIWPGWVEAVRKFDEATA